MPTVAKGKVATVQLAIGDMLVVSCPAGVTNVWRVDPRPPAFRSHPRMVVIGKGQRTTIGPYIESTTHKIDAMSGDAVYTVTDRLGAELKSITQNTITPAAKIAAVIVNHEGLVKQMALRDKFKTLADRAKKLPTDLEKKADAVNQRLDDLDKRGVNAFAMIDSTLDDVEGGVKATEDLVNQLTNGGPPLTDAPKAPATTPPAVPPATK